MNEKHAAALEYASKGLRVFPVSGKLPTIKGWPSLATTQREQIDAWWKENPNADIGVATGAGLTVLDCDDENVLSVLYELAPEFDWAGAPRVKTGRGFHFYLSGDSRNTAGKIAEKIDSRGEGGYVIVPPSEHVDTETGQKTGRVYSWDVPLNGHLPAMPDAIRKALENPSPERRPKVSAGGKGHVDMTIPTGQRNSALASFAGSLRRAGATAREIYAAIRERNHSCTPPLDDKELQNIAKSMGRYEQGVRPALLVHKLSSVKRQKAKWVWKNRIPRGALTVFEGDPGTRKSWCSEAIASAMTAGHSLPGDGPYQPANVLILSAEDSEAHTIRPHMEDLGADLDRVVILEGTRARDGSVKAFNLDDMGTLRAAVEQHEPQLIIIDPIIAYMAGKNEWRASEVRSLLAPLAALAALADLAVIAIRHLSKGGSKSIYRGQGSIDFLAAARSCFLIGEDPEDSDKSILIHQKSSLAPKTPSLVFSVKDGIFTWEGESNMTAEQLLTPITADEGKSQLGQAEEFLREILASESVLSKDIFKQGKQAGFSERTLFRAKSELGVVKARKTMDGWTWELKN